MFRLCKTDNAQDVALIHMGDEKYDWEEVGENEKWGKSCEQTVKLEQNRLINIIVGIYKLACWLTMCSKWIKSRFLN